MHFLSASLDELAKSEDNYEPYRLVQTLARHNLTKSSTKVAWRYGITILTLIVIVYLLYQRVLQITDNCERERTFKMSFKNLFKFFYKNDIFTALS